MGGTVSLLKKGLRTLSFLKTMDELEKLYVQDNRLASLETLALQPHLQELWCQNNDICDFAGVVEQPRMHTVYLDGNPVCSRANWRVTCILAFGLSLKKVNGQAISRAERQLAIRLGKNAKLAVFKGWIPSHDPADDVKTTRSVELFLKETESEEAKSNLVVTPASESRESLSEVLSPTPPQPLSVSAPSLSSSPVSMRTLLARKEEELRLVLQQLEGKTHFYQHLHVRVQKALKEASYQNDLVSTLRAQLQREKSKRKAAEKSIALFSDELKYGFGVRKPSRASAMRSSVLGDSRPRASASSSLGTPPTATPRKVSTDPLELMRYGNVPAPVTPAGEEGGSPTPSSGEPWRSTLVQDEISVQLNQLQSQTLLGASEPPPARGLRPSSSTEIFASLEALVNQSISSDTYGSETTSESEAKKPLPTWFTGSPQVASNLDAEWDINGRRKSAKRSSLEASAADGDVSHDDGIALDIDSTEAAPPPTSSPASRSTMNWDFNGRRVPVKKGPRRPARGTVDKLAEAMALREQQATAIQSLWRQRVARRLLKELKTEHQQSQAAVCIQSCCRGLLARRALKRERDRIEEENRRIEEEKRRKEELARQLQEEKERRQLEWERQKKIQEEEERKRKEAQLQKEIVAAIAVQRGWRRRCERQSAKEAAFAKMVEEVRLRKLEEDRKKKEEERKKQMEKEKREEAERQRVEAEAARRKAEEDRLAAEREALEAERRHLEEMKKKLEQEEEEKRQALLLKKVEEAAAEKRRQEDAEKKAIEEREFKKIEEQVLARKKELDEQAATGRARSGSVMKAIGFMGKVRARAKQRAEGVDRRASNLSGVASPSSQKGVDEADSTEQMSLLTQGALFIKHGRRGDPHRRLVYCSGPVPGAGSSSSLPVARLRSPPADVGGLTSVVWSDPDGNKSSGMAIDDIIEVRRGVGSPNFGRAIQKISRKEPVRVSAMGTRCFTLVGHDRSLDFETTSMEQREQFADAFEWLLRTRR